MVGIQVLAAEAVQAQQRIHADLLPLADAAVERLQRQCQRGLVGAIGHPHPAGGHVDEQVGQQLRGSATPAQGLPLVFLHQPQQRGAAHIQQGRELLVQDAFAATGRRHRVKAHHHVQTKTGQRLAPGGLIGARRAHEIEQGQQRHGTTGQNLQLVAVLGEHRVAGVDHIEGGIALQQLPQHLGLLLEAPRCPRGLQELLHPRGPVQPAPGACRLTVQRLQQGNGVFHAGGVIQRQQRRGADAQAHAFHMPRGAGARRYFAEVAVTGQRAQQRGLAGIGVADHGDAQRAMGDSLSHGGSASVLPARRR